MASGKVHAAVSVALAVPAGLVAYVQLGPDAGLAAVAGCLSGVLTNLQSQYIIQLSHARKRGAFSLMAADTSIIKYLFVRKAPPFSGLTSRRVCDSIGY